MTRIMDLARFYSPPSLIGTRPEAPQWAPDGSALAFLWNDAGGTFLDLWQVAAPAAGDASRPRRLTRLEETMPGISAGGISACAWLGGVRLAFLADGLLYIRAEDGGCVAVSALPFPVTRMVAAPDGSSLAIIAAGAVFLWNGTGEPRMALGAEPLVYGEQMSWSEDGKWLAIVQADDRKVRQIRIAYDAGGEARVDTHSRAFPGDALTRRRVAVLPVAGGDPVWLERPDDEDAIWGFGLSAKGERLFVSSSDLSIKTHEIFVLDLATGRSRLVYRAVNPVKIRPDWQVAWDIGGHDLILTTDAPSGWTHLHLLPTGMEPAGVDALRPLTSGPWEIAVFHLAPTGDIAFLSNRSHPAERQVSLLLRESGSIRDLTSRPGTHQPVFSPGFSHMADIFSSDSTPPDLYMQPLAGGPAAQVTRSALPEFGEYAWARTVYIPFTSHVDGAELMARVMLPPDHDPARRYPVVVGSVYSDGMVNQWGGRIAHPSWGLDQFLVSRGFIVVAPEIRGSFGRGEAWNRSMLHSYGTQDIEDIADCVTALIGRGLADSARVGIWGSSYGGLMTLMSLFKKPGFYAAGIAGAPATSVFHAYPEQEWIMGPPRGADFPARYEAQSALYQAGGLQDPLMIIHGTADEVVLYSDTIALAERLIAAGKLFELVTLPGATHGWDKQGLAQTRFAFGKMVEFFERHLLPPCPPAP